jgi:hypothetical protein
MSDMDRFERVLDAAKVYKLRSERTSYIARRWLDSEEVVPMLNALSQEMMYTGALVEVEKFKLAAQKMGVDFAKLLELSNQCHGEATANLKAELDKDSEVLSKAVAEDVEEQRAWAAKVDPAREKKALSLDLDKIPVCYPPFPKAPERSSFIALQQESSSLAKILSNKKETFRGLAEELAGEEPWPDVEDIIRFTPSPQQPEPQPGPQDQPGDAPQP